MSRGNVEIVRAAIEAWNRGDWEAAFEHAAPDVEFDNTRDLGEWRGVHTTAGQVKRMLERFADLWESSRVDLDELIDAGDQVISRHTGTYRGRDGIEVTVRNNLLWQFRDGAITRVVSYREREDALRAAGLAE